MASINWSIQGLEKGSLGKALFKSVKSTHTFHFFDFFLTTTVLANHLFTPQKNMLRLSRRKQIKLNVPRQSPPSKPNLPSAPKPSKLLAPTGLHRTLSSLAYRIPQSPIASIKMNWSLLNCFPSTKKSPHRDEYGDIRIWLMYLSMMCQ